MKKLLTLLFMMIAMTANAQWQRTVIEADELKGIEGGEVYMYTDSQMGSFIFWGWDKFQYRLTSDHAQFNIQLSAGYVGVLAMVGIYDYNDNLIEKFKMWLDLEDNTGNQYVKTRNAGGMANPVGQKGKVKKIFKALQSGIGYVRIVAERYNTTDFDIKIPPYKE